jgi:hypothetical protein
MDLRRRLRIILDRVQLSQRELELQPEAFQATEELRQVASEIASILEELEASEPIKQSSGPMLVDPEELSRAVVDPIANRDDTHLRLAAAA